MMNPNVDNYLVDGCGRCDYYRTPQCKVNSWREELIALRQIILKTELKEEYKWSQPCYTLKGKNILIATAFKDYACISFFKGSLLKDPKNLLTTPGKNSQAARQFRFTSINEVLHNESHIKEFINQAIDLEKAGKNVVFQKNPEPYPEELITKFNEDPALENAFNKLTPGRKRGYILNFSQPKQSKTRTARIEKWLPSIMQGKGIHDDYRSKMKK